jgi:hypothetical protein
VTQAGRIDTRKLKKLAHPDWANDKRRGLKKQTSNEKVTYLCIKKCPCVTCHMFKKPAVASENNNNHDLVSKF